MKTITEKRKQKLIREAVSFRNKLISALEMVLNGRLHKFQSNKYKFVNLDCVSELIFYCDLIVNHQFRKAQNVQRNMDTHIYMRKFRAFFGNIWNIRNFNEYSN